MSLRLGMPRNNEAAREEAPRDSRERLAMAYWDGVLDARNVDARGAVEQDARAVERDIKWADAPDLRAAQHWLNAPRENGSDRKAHISARQKAPVVDLGAGLGGHAFALARRGDKVIAADASLARLRALSTRARAAGLREQVWPVLADAHALPFASNSVQKIMTKSMLIHTDMRASAAEIARVLAPGGRAALIEPQTGNPFVAIYRKLLAPKAWDGITTYFNRERRGVYMRALPEGRHGARYYYCFAFFAHVFQFALPSPLLFKLTMAPLNALDRALFCLFPLTRRCAWFGMICLEKDRGDAGA